MDASLITLFPIERMGGGRVKVFLRDANILNYPGRGSSAGRA